MILEYNLDKYNVNYNFVKNVKEGDTLTLKCNIFEKGQSKDLTGYTAELRWVNANNTFVSVLGSKVTIDGNVVTIQCDNNCTKSAGICKFELHLHSNAEEDYSFTQDVNVLASVIQGQDIAHNINTVIDDLNEANINAEKFVKDYGNLYGIKDKVDELNNTKANQTDLAETNKNVSVNSARIDQFTKLPTGSTSGDAELIDIRIMTDGNTAETAGEAVREQIESILCIIDMYDKEFINNLSKNQIGKNVDNDNIFIYSSPIPIGNKIKSIKLYTSSNFSSISRVYILEKISDSKFKILSEYSINSTGNVEINYLVKNSSTYIGIYGKGSTKYSTDLTDMNDAMLTIPVSTLDNPQERKDMVLLSSIILEEPVTKNMYTKEEIDNGFIKAFKELHVFPEDNLMEKIYFAVKSEEKNIKIIVEPGVHDWVEEISNLDTNNTTGISLANGIYIKFLKGAKIVCNYTGSNTYINSQFSIFNADIKRSNADYTLEDVVIEASNIRYIVHDEMHNTNNSYIHKYKNCDFNLDNSKNPVWNSEQCIGGGLGKSGDIEIEDCIFNTVKTTSGTHTDVSYHNNSKSDSESNVKIKNSYFSGTFRISSYGSSTKKSRAIINNCSLESKPFTSFESPDYTIENVEILDFNNEIRD